MSGLSSNVEIRVFSQERHAGDASAFNFDGFHLIDLHHVLESDVIEDQFQTRIGQRSAAAPGNDDRLNPVSQLQQRLEQTMILMIVSDKNVIDYRRQIGVSEAIVL